MYYVYILRSIYHPKEIYTGYTANLKLRLKWHNLGLSIHTKKFCPWRVESYFAFSNRFIAIRFEKYLKSGSGIAFRKKRFVCEDFF